MTDNAPACRFFETPGGTRRGGRNTQTAVGVLLVLAWTSLGLPCAVTASLPDTSCPSAQLPVPGVGGGFGIDGNLVENSPAVPPYNTATDWNTYINSSGTPTELLAFHAVDLTGNNDKDRFTRGTKVHDNPNTAMHWDANSTPAKDDIQNGYLRFFEDGFGDLWATVGGDRRSTDGTSYIDFEFLQNSLTKQPGGSFLSLGPDGGRTVGDLLFTIKLDNGGTQASFSTRRWEEVSAAPGTFDYVERCLQPGQALVAENIDPTAFVPWGAFGSTSYQPFAFGEGGVNLTQLLGDRFDESSGVRTVFIRTKASASDDAEMKDFIEPVQVNLLVNSGSAPTVSFNFTDAVSPRSGTPKEAPETLHLSRAMPNPTQGSTSLHLDLGARAWVRATVHDVAGRLVDRVVEGPLEAGSNTLAWNGMGAGGEQAAAGVYFFRIWVDDRMLTRTIIVVH